MKTILLIDDSGVQLRMMQSLLRDRYRVLLASNGTAGNKLAQEKNPDLIILDYDMPVLNGKETLDLLRADERTKDIPVIFLTALNDNENIQKIMEWKPQGYLAKPVRTEILLAKVEQALSGR